MSLKPLGLLCMIFACLAGATHAAAAKADVLGVFGDWSAFKESRGTKKVYFMTSRPKATKMPKGASRGTAYIHVQNDQTRNVKGEVYIVAGFTYNENKPIQAIIDGRTYELSGVKDAAWIFDSKAERNFVNAMARGNKMTVKQISSHGTPVIDSYSLNGFTGAKNAIDKACAK